LEAADPREAGVSLEDSVRSKDPVTSFRQITTYQYVLRHKF
jgi:hypothetical protein